MSGWCGSSRGSRVVLGALLLALAILGSVPVSAGARTRGASPFIQGGTEHYSPFLARVATQTNEGERICSGTVIAPNWILTAGHCVGEENGGNTYPASAFKVYTGNVEWEHATVSAVAEALRDPGYADQFSKFPQEDIADDVGLLHLSAPVTVEPIVLATPQSFSRVVDGASLSAAGFGLTSPNGTEPSKTMQLVTGLTVENVPASGSNERGEGNDILIESSSNKGTCKGDSGGPFIDSVEEEVAVTSFGVASACNGTYAQRIDVVDPWIDEKVESSEPPVVDSIAPASGQAGAQITIHGSGFGTASTVTFGKVPAESFRIVSWSEITATAPAGKGKVDVRVSSASTESPAVAADKFAYVKPPKPKDYTACYASGGSEECFEAFEVFTKTHTWQEGTVASGTYTVTGKDYVFSGEERHTKVELVGVKGKKGVIAGEVHGGYFGGHTFTLTPR